VRASYFNTTGVIVNGRLVRRRKIAGHVRLDGVSGFNPNYPSRAIGRVFECAEPCVWNGQNKVLFRRLLHTAAKPDYFLVVTRSAEVGRLDLTATDRPFDNPLAPLGERVAIPQSRDSWVRGSTETMTARSYAGRDTSDWKSNDTLLISFSECDCQQEALLLMPAYGFVRTELGTFFLEPLAMQPHTARLRIETGFGDTSCVTQKGPSN
jgi:hypothetical protein